MVDAAEIAYVTAFLASDKSWAISGELVVATGGAGRSVYYTRGSLRTAVAQWLRTGLPIVAVVVAINPIWGFSWYFNTENWASAFWEKVTEARTDVWREAMIAAVEREVGPAVVGADDPAAARSDAARPVGT